MIETGDVLHLRPAQRHRGGHIGAIVGQDEGGGRRRGEVHPEQMRRRDGADVSGAIDGGGGECVITAFERADRHTRRLGRHIRVDAVEGQAMAADSRVPPVNAGGVAENRRSVVECGAVGGAEECNALGILSVHPEGHGGCPLRGHARAHPRPSR
jgi:hypothetical protein